MLRLNYKSPAQYDFGGGWGHPGSEFIMPVSPRLAVYTQVGKHHAGPILLDTAKTRQLQQLFVERAYRWVLARQPIPWMKSFARASSTQFASKPSARRGKAGITSRRKTRRSLRVDLPSTRGPRES